MTINDKKFEAELERFRKLTRRVRRRMFCREALDALVANLILTLAIAIPVGLFLSQSGRMPGTPLLFVLSTFGIALIATAAGLFASPRDRFAAEKAIDRRYNLEDRCLTASDTLSQATDRETTAAETAQLRDCFENNDLKLFTIYAHAVKGSAANIGAETLSAFALKFEEAGRQENTTFIKENLDAFLLQLSTITQNVSKYLFATNNNSDQTKEAGSVDILRQKAPVLFDRAVNTDIIAIEDILEEISAFSWGEPFSTALADIKKASDVFDYESIAEAVTRLQKLL